MRIGNQSYLCIENTLSNGTESPAKRGKKKSDTYISLLAIAEYRRVTVGHESWYSESYAEASHVTSEMREALDRHNLSRPNEAERMRSAEGVRMGSDPGENISPPGHNHTPIHYPSG